MPKIIFLFVYRERKSCWFNWFDLSNTKEVTTLIRIKTDKLCYRFYKIKKNVWTLYELLSWTVTVAKREQGMNCLNNKSNEIIVIVNDWLLISVGF